MSIEALNWAWEQPVSKAATKLVLLALADHSNADGECWPSMKRIAERSDISTRHVSRAIDELVTLGLVEKANRRRHGGQYRGWDYRLLVQRTPASSGHGVPVTSGHGRPSPADTGVRSEPTENRKKEPMATSSRKTVNDGLFDKVAEVCGWNTANLTKSARGQLNKAVKELREVKATAEEVGGKAAAYREKYPGIDLTPTALIKHWAALYVRKVEVKQSIWETYNPPESYYT